MKKPTSKQLDAIVKLQANQDFVVFMSWITSSRNLEAVDSVDQGAEPMRSWMQGRVQQLTILLGIVKDADRLLPLVLQDERNKEG